MIIISSKDKLYLPLDIIVKKKSLSAVVFVILCQIAIAFSCVLALCHGNVTSFYQSSGIMVTNSFVMEACAVLTEDMDRLQPLTDGLKQALTWHEKYEYISADPVVIAYLSSSSFVHDVLQDLPVERAYVLLSVVAIGQANSVLDPQHLTGEDSSKRLSDLIDALLIVEEFYAEIGGVVGYHLAMMKCLCRPQERAYGVEAMYHAPKMIDICHLSSEVKEGIYSCIENLPIVAEIYPVGGAADRLKLYDIVTGQSLPAATLHYCGMTLLERLVRDVQVKEYLYFKFKHKQLTLPIAMMTSTEKNNHERIMTLCRDRNFFNREEKSFFFFCQPCVPTMDQHGQWALRGALQPLLRPGGHGVIWKLARDVGCFEWLKEHNIRKILVRQINNPVASEDYGLYAFTGLGLKHDHAIGFCSCPRLVKSAEGTNVLIEEKKGDLFEHTLTNIEYCDFPKYGIADKSAQEGGAFSKYPSNTNLLFVDIQAIKEALIHTPIPGMLVNLKKISYQDEFGVGQEELLARLESMMQNIADCFTQTSSCSYVESEISLRSFITFNQRSKTISTTKKEVSEGSLLETPDGCFIDMMRNAQELLHLCGFVLDLIDHQGGKPLFSFLYHPALGPFYSIIAQKMRKGRIARGSEIYLSIAELDVEALDVDGSFHVIADDVMGHSDSRGLLIYSETVGRCSLRNVSVRNRGVNYDRPYVLWKGEVERQEGCYIRIMPGGEFIAEDVCFNGPYSIVVAPGTKMRAFQLGDEVGFSVETVTQPSWVWRYAFNEEKDVLLHKVVTK